MRFYEIAEPTVGAVITPTAAPQPGAAPVAQQTADPTPEQLKQGEQLLGTIDPTTTPPQEATNKLTGWLKQYPWLDRATDLLPATRVIKAAAAAIDALQAGNPQQALQAFAGAATGGLGKTVQQANTLTNTGTALAQGDIQGAALAAGGNVGKLAQTATVGQNLAQNNLAGAAQAAGGTVARAANLAQKAQNIAPTIQAALQPQQPVTESIDRIKRLSGL